MLVKRTSGFKKKFISQSRHELMPWLKLFFILGFSIILSACQTASPAFFVAGNPSGFGGTGVKQENTSGFGGTGKSSPGFGGTGIVGTITRFGSIWVNGIEIGYGPQTKITSNLSNTDSLKKGKQVVLETLPLKNKTLTKSIRIFYPIAGEITHKTSNVMVINRKYKVTLNSDTLKDKGINEKVGSFIVVNGYQVAQNKWVATRLNLNPGKDSFYHEIPALHFSTRVNRVIIEAGLMQLDNLRWHDEIKSQFEGIQRLIIEAKGRNAANFRPEEIEPYHNFIRNLQRERAQMGEMKRGNEASKRIMEMQELKNQQNSLIQKQSELLDQQKQMMEMRRMRSRELRRLELRPE